MTADGAVLRIKESQGVLELQRLVFFRVPEGPQGKTGIQRIALE